jgi:hypothetical protein
MQTLGLSSEPKRSDGWVKSLLWPAVDNAWDVNYLGQQGFWICMLLAVFSLVITMMTGTGTVIIVGLLTFLFYVLGGMGVREGSWQAAALVLAVHGFGILAGVAAGQLPNVFSVLFGVVLLSNLRATFLASEWKPAAEGEDSPTRFSESFADKLVDQMPAKLWPVLRVPFYILAVLMVLLVLGGLGVILARRFGVLPHFDAAHPVR